MTVRRALTLLVLGLWLFLGPVSMAFDGCLLMGALCDGGPCGASCSVSFAPSTGIALDAVALLDTERDGQPRPNAVGTLEPPPKPLLPAA